MAGVSELDWGTLSYEERAETAERLAERAVAIKSKPHGDLPAATIHAFFDGDVELPGRDVEFLEELAKRNRLRLRPALFAKARGMAHDALVPPPARAPPSRPSGAPSRPPSGAASSDGNPIRPKALRVTVTAGAVVSIMGGFGLFSLYWLGISSGPLPVPFLFFFMAGVALLLVSIAIEVWRNP